jgi:DNA-binding transcriptional regulator LsrR (DeoR family)
MKAQGHGATEIAKALGIGRASVNRVLEALDRARSTITGGRVA